jgi:hypothetical protein
MDQHYGQGKFLSDCVADLAYVPLKDGQLARTMEVLDVLFYEYFFVDTKRVVIDMFSETLLVVVINLAMLLAGRPPLHPRWLQREWEIVGTRRDVSLATQGGIDWMKDFMLKHPNSTCLSRATVEYDASLDPEDAIRGGWKFKEMIERPSTRQAFGAVDSVSKECPPFRMRPVPFRNDGYHWNADRYNWPMIWYEMERGEPAFHHAFTLGAGDNYETKLWTQGMEYQYREIATRNLRWKRDHPKKI